MNAVVTADTAYTIKLTPGFRSDTAAEFWEVYVDCNQDGVFSKSERLVTGKKSGTLSKTLTAPLTAKNGFTRMRIMIHFDSALNQPCDSFINGEAEDYTLIITGGTSKNVASPETSEDLKYEQASEPAILIIPNSISSSSAKILLNIVKQGNEVITITDLSGRTLLQKEIENLHKGKN